MKTVSRVLLFVLGVGVLVGAVYLGMEIQKRGGLSAIVAGDGGDKSTFDVDIRYRGVTPLFSGEVPMDFGQPANGVANGGMHFDGAPNSPVLWGNGHFYLRVDENGVVMNLNVDR